MKERRPTQSLELVCLAGLLVFVFLSGFFQVSDCDVGYHLRTAAHILAGKGIPTTNTFSWSTPEHPWLLHQWVGTITFYLAFALGGVASLITFKAFVCALIMLLAWCSARMMARPGSWWPFWVVTAGTLAARHRFFERPDLLSALVFALLLYLDAKWDKNRRWQWIGLPLLMAAWANTHAGVIYGFAVLAVLVGVDWLETRSAEAGRRVEPVAAWSLLVRPIGFVLSVLASCATVQLINPNGCRVLWFPISQFSSKFWQGIILEYQPPRWLSEKAFFLFFAAVVGLQLLTFRRINWRLLLVSVAFGYLAWRSQRSLLFFVIAAVPHAAYMLDCLWPRLGRTAVSIPNLTPQTAVAVGQVTQMGLAEPSMEARSFTVRPSVLLARRWEIGALIATWVLTVLLVFIPDRAFRFGVGWYHPYYPVELYQFVQREVTPQGIFNEMRYGGSLLWWLYPGFKPFIDGRGDAYSEQFWLKNYLPVLQAKEDWREVLKRYDLHCILLPLPETGDTLPLVRTLLSDPEWALVAFNDDALLFLERTPTNSGAIARNEFKVLRPGDWTYQWVEAPDKRGQGALETTRALTLSPESRFARTAQTRIFMAEGRFHEAAEELLRILRGHPEASGSYWRDYGYALCRTERLAEADRIFSKMIGKDQFVGYAYFMKHYIALDRHELAAADRYLARALKVEPGNPEYNQARGNLDKMIGGGTMTLKTEPVLLEPQREEPNGLELSVVIPCLNEADTLGICVGKAARSLSENGIRGEIIVADNGSTDGSQEIAVAGGARVVRVAEKGYGSALMAGIAVARGTFVIMGDADDSYDFTDIPKFLSKLREGSDLVQGCRFPSGGGRIEVGAMRFTHRWFGNPLFSLLVRTWFHAPVRDVYCGLRGFRKAMYDRLDQRCTGMEFATEMIIKASLAGAQIDEAPVVLYRDGRKSHAPHLKTVRDGWRTLRYFLMCSPRWLFLWPGALLAALGLLCYGVALPGLTVHGIRFDAHTLLFGSLFMICGYQSIFFALFARTFAFTSGLLPPNPRLLRFYEVMDLEKGLLAAGAALGTGALLLVVAINDWRLAGFGDLNYAKTMRLVIPGATSITLGFQTFLSSFLISIMGMKHK